MSMKRLTLEALKTAKFRMAIHLNRDKEHDLVHTCEEWGIHTSQTTRMRDYTVIKRVLYTGLPNVPQVNLLEKNNKAREHALRDFVEKYNAALAAKEEQRG